MIKSFFPCFGLGLGLLAVPAFAQPLFTDLDEVVQIEVREGWRDANGRHFAALEVRLAEGWKTYWRSPGSTGIAPQIGWAGSRNLSAAALHWPTPSAFETAGYPSLGYVTDFVLPIELQPGDPAAPISLSATIDIGICLDICLPAKITIEAELPPRGAPDAVIAAALKDHPQAGRGQVTCSIRPSDSGVVLSAAIPQGRALGAYEAVAVEILHARDRIWIADTAVTREGAVLRTQTEFMRPDDTPVSLDRSGLRFTVVGDQGAVEYFGCVGR
jgi:DsbC/DsbD-like thiol-disulfide interchange protein